MAVAGPPRGAHLRVDLVIPLERVLTGGKETVTITRPGRCPQRAGSGAVPGTAVHSCPDRGGTGPSPQLAAAEGGGPAADYLPGLRRCRAGRAVGKVTICIPRGVPAGTTLRLAGRGLPSSVSGGPPGDAYVVIRTGTDPRFIRAGADLWYDLHMGVPGAALGTTAAVPAFDGEAHVRVPPGTQPGDVLTVKGKGLPRFHGHGRGSLNATVIMDIPRRLSPRQRAADGSVPSGWPKPG